MKRVVFTAVVLLVFITGLTILLYPYVTGYINSLSQTRVVQQYHRDVETLSEDEFIELFEAARAYNEALAKKGSSFTLSEAEIQEYLGMLDPFGNGVIGTLTIDKINVNLPIYHGTNEGVLQMGAGHLEGSSLPIGGAGTHTVITGHRGLPTSLLLTELDKLVIGDTFTLNVLNETMVYEVDRIIVVEPHELEELAIVSDKDYCTLVTCTPYGINSHRMLIRGERKDTGQEQGQEEVTGDRLQVFTEAGTIDSRLVAGILLIPPFVIVAVYLGISIRKLRGRGRTK